MHNGLKVLTHGYYGRNITRLLARNRGCHEPQEEAVFAEVISTLPEGASIVECGAYWGFYSLWFLTAVHDAHAFLIEPDSNNLTVGQENFRLNGFNGCFTHAYVGNCAGIHSDGTAIVAIDSFVQERSLGQIDLLHADIQGAEFDMLMGARDLLRKRGIGYIFLSTHTPELHERCRSFLKANGYSELVSINIAESYSADGILIFYSPDIVPPPVPYPSRKSTGNSTAPKD
jgi:hypothetical protein